MLRNVAIICNYFALFVEKLCLFINKLHKKVYNFHCWHYSTNFYLHALMKIATNHLQLFACIEHCWKSFNIKTKRQAHAPVLMVIQQCSIFPGRRQPSIFDDEKLNFCVRYVYRWILFSIATGYGIITSFLEIIILT